jgi:hypothetical protein
MRLITVSTAFFLLLADRNDIFDEENEQMMCRQGVEHKNSKIISCPYV